MRTLCRGIFAECCPVSCGVFRCDWSACATTACGASCGPVADVACCWLDDVMFGALKSVGETRWFDQVIPGSLLPVVDGGRDGRFCGLVGGVGPCAGIDGYSM